MKNLSHKSIAVLLLLMSASLPVLAHPGHSGGMVSFFGGFIHPLTGPDHLLAMLAIGIWSSTKTRYIWLGPAGFLCMLFVGAMLASTGLSIPAVEQMTVVSVFVLGLLIATRLHVPDAMAALLIAGFAFFHGAAHGFELGNGVALIGMGAASAALLASGVAIGIACRARGMFWWRIIGASIATTGVGLMFSL